MRTSREARRNIGSLATPESTALEAQGGPPRVWGFRSLGSRGLGVSLRLKVLG